MTGFLFDIHIASLALAAVGIVVADHSALNWMLGRVDRAHRAAVFSAHWFVSIGLAGLVLSGLALFWPMRQYLLGEPLFWLKMFFVGCLLINSFFVEMLMHRAVKYPFRELPFSQKVPLFISGGVSTLCWLGAGFTALALF